MFLPEAGITDAINIFKYVLTQNKVRTTGLGPSPPEKAPVALGKVLCTSKQDLLPGKIYFLKSAEEYSLDSLSIRSYLEYLIPIQRKDLEHFIVASDTCPLMAGCR